MKTTISLALLAALVMGLGCSKKAAVKPGSSPAATVAASSTPSAAASPSQPGASLLLERVHFPLDRWELTVEATRTLANDAKQLLASPGLRIRVEGHADERGSTAYNLALSEKRAAVVRAYLVDLGVASSRIDTVAYGEERPLVDADGESAWSKNRRGDLVVTGSNAPTTR